MMPPSPFSVALICMSQQGHVQRTLPVIEALARRGCKVHVFTGKDHARSVTRFGGCFHDLFAEGPLESVDGESMPRPSRYVTFAAQRLSCVRSRVAALRPSLLLYDTFAVIARLIARDLAIPAVNLCAGHAMVPSQILSDLATDPQVRTASACHEAVARLRDEHGMDDASPFSYIDGISDILNLYAEPPQFLNPAEREVFQPLAFFGALSSAIGSSAIGSFPIPRRDPSRRRIRRVLIAFGTVVWHYFPQLAETRLRTLVAGLAPSGCDLLISTGGYTLSAATQAALETAGARVQRWLHQQEALQQVDALITHHGLNSTHEAIWFGVPMLSCPFFSDQPALARRCQELGLALPLLNAAGGDLSAEGVRTQLQALEADLDGFAERLQTARGWEIATMAGRPAIVERLLALA